MVNVFQARVKSEDRTIPRCAGAAMMDNPDVVRWSQLIDL
jgi:hypothetical protein